mmetsp:Transcript_40645/g.88521  ORF Transcript_40645/g.88521 Transcript_40645/m.88521 type:complete len:345 (+) Transcript_40645:1291-2325(+)
MTSGRLLGQRGFTCREAAPASCACRLVRSDVQQKSLCCPALGPTAPPFYAAALKSWSVRERRCAGMRVGSVDFMTGPAEARVTSVADVSLHISAPSGLANVVGRRQEPARPGSSELPIPDEEAAKVYKVKVVSWLSLVLCSILGGIAFVVGVMDDQVALVGLAVEIWLDGMSSALVLWRYKKGKRRDGTATELQRFKAERNLRRERNASWAMGVVFVFSAIILAIKACVKLLTFRASGSRLKTEHGGASVGALISWPCFFVFGGLACVKLALSKQLDSDTLKADALCSLLASLLAFVVGVSESLATRNGWVADPVAALLVAGILLVEGAKQLRSTQSDRHVPLS